MFFRHKHLIGFGEHSRFWLWLRRLFYRLFFYIRKRILRISATPHKVALGFSVGIFLACSPFFGFHIILAVFLSWIFRGNFAAAIIGTIFSNPLTFLFIIMVDYKIGSLFLSFFGDVNEISLSQVRTMFDGLTVSKIWLIFENMWSLIMLPMIIGGALLGFILGILSYIGVYRAIVRFQQKQHQRMIKKNTFARENSGDVL
ncbi:DUF2062 domain-containing protein [Bartonella sp. F02]|uniref:DUF2062 domain-containing protein n=1 Tax=Bartonella sp. F02 TaxID=2967262 RepID=UPI0022A94538|nr:DUF2062 domain-containing protein [Bartonella sp. F02]MCZ2328530.1 DUF2062 domain-containing protein [Bartonella sp. F02]